MTTIESQMKKFNIAASPCKAHGLRPVYSYDGIHHIECPSGCSMADAENADLGPIMERWEWVNTKP
jgi:hypothetical protein